MQQDVRMFPPLLSRVRGWRRPTVVPLCGEPSDYE